MISATAKAYFEKKYKDVQYFIDNPISVQEDNLKYLLEHGKNTEFGAENNFQSISSISDFQKNVSINTYENLRPYLDKIIVEKKENVLWDTPIKWFAMSSGTTQDRSKYIPVTNESLNNCHYRCGYHMLSMYLHNFPESKFLFGKSLVLGGSQQINNIGNGIFTGDVSAILMKNLPFWAKFSRTPESIALIPDWEEKLVKLTNYALKTDIRSMVGVPSWMLVLLKKMVEVSGKKITDIWPDIDVFFHGGVSFVPFAEQFEKMIPKSSMNYWETYNASEGFFGIQYSPDSKDLLLLLDNEIFYEFLPVSEWDSENPQAVTLNEVECGKQYAMIITTSGGLWRYNLGDTIEFKSTKPYLFKISGRTKSFINAFGEEVIIENADKALSEASQHTNARVKEYTAAPVYFGDSNNGAHEWLIEFEKEPDNLEKFTDVLDETLRKVNSDYDAKRSYNLSLNRPIVRSLPKDTFYEWMKNRGKIGGQNKVPRLSNDRKIVESITNFMNDKS